MATEAPDALRAYVQDNGMKRSKQRDLIADVFFKTTEHLRVDDLLERVREEDPRIGQATVYRTLKLLEKAGLADAHQFGDGHTRYEPAHGEEDHHDHLICVFCGSIQEVRWPELEKIQQKVCRELGFEPQWHRHEIFGKCADCAKKKG